METGALFSASVLSLHLAFCAGSHVNSSRIYFQLASARLTEEEPKNRASASQGYFKILCDFSVRWRRCSVFLSKQSLKNKQTKKYPPFKKGKKSLGIKLLCHVDDLMGPAVILNWLKWLRTWLVTTICRVYRERSEKLMWRKMPFWCQGSEVWMQRANNYRLQKRSVYSVCERTMPQTLR